MKKKRNALMLLIFIFTGALIGGILGELLSKYKYLSWLSLGGLNGYRQLFDFTLKSIDLGIIKFAFSLSMRINIGSILGMISGILIFVRV